MGRCFAKAYNRRYGRRGVFAGWWNQNTILLLTVITHQLFVARAIFCSTGRPCRSRKLGVSSATSRLRQRESLMKMRSWCAPVLDNFAACMRAAVKTACATSSRDSSSGIMRTVLCIGQRAASRIHARLAMLSSEVVPCIIRAMSYNRYVRLARADARVSQMVLRTRLPEKPCFWAVASILVCVGKPIDGHRGFVEGPRPRYQRYQQHQVYTTNRACHASLDQGLPSRDQEKPADD